MDQSRTPSDGEKKTPAQVWLQAARLRTLPLSCSSVVLAAGLAALEGKFNRLIFALSVITAVLLQILSNFANDYGDAMKGTDGQGRVGPSRTVSSGSIHPQTMFRAILIMAALSLLSGIGLLWVSCGTNPIRWGVFLGLGLASVAAAVFYTMGRHPYGYYGLGDLFVFVFFGLVAVGGSWALYDAPLSHMPGLPACAAGCFITAVININNIRDMDNDRACGKNTLALQLGEVPARVYHLSLIGTGLVCWGLWLTVSGLWQALPLLLGAAPLVWSAAVVWRTRQPDVLDQQLKVTSLGTGFFHILMAIALPLIK